MGTLNVGPFSRRHLAFGCPFSDRDEIIEICDFAD
jgi:hypothetical protein